MSPAEHIYRILLRLYPAEHRREYGRLMLQHAHDLSRYARRRGRLHLAVLYLKLVVDGLVNAIIEHGEAIMTAKGTFKPTPWLTILLVTVPGLWIALTRRNTDQMLQLLLILLVAYILFMAIALPVVWWRKGQFPVWGLLFAGALAWFLTFRAGMALTDLKWIPGIFEYEMGIIFLKIMMAIILFVILLRGRRVSNAVWAIIGIMVLGNCMLAIIDGYISFGGASQMRHIQRFFMISLYGPAEGLMLIAVGLLAARQHGILAMLVVVGGYISMFIDTDYLFGYPSREWPGLSLYFFSVSFLFLVLIPVALLRAKTRLGRALAVFIPAVIFLVARLTIPALVFLRQPLAVRSGDVVLSLNVLLSLILAWILYGQLYETSGEIQAGGLKGGLKSLAGPE